MPPTPNVKPSRDNRQVAKADAKRIREIALLLNRVMECKTIQEIEKLPLVDLEDSMLSVTKRYD